MVLAESPIEVGAFIMGLIWQLAKVRLCALQQKGPLLKLSIQIKDMADRLGVSMSYLVRILGWSDGGKVIKGKVGVRCMREVNRVLRCYGCNR